MAKKVLVKDNKILSLNNGKVLCAPENYDLDTYLNFYMPFGGTITLRRVGSPTVVELEYSTDGGSTWTIWEEVDNDRTLTLPVEGRMWLRNTSVTSTRFSLDTSNYYNIILNKLTFANGKINSLLCKNPDNATCSDFCFSRLFSNYGAGYRNLVTSPILTFTTLSVRSYYSLFSGAFPLHKVVTYMTDISANSCLYIWMADINTSGDFYCDQNLTIPSGQNGIPSGWTRHDLSELE